ncbi:hypothetical protein [Aquincola tertiaricarbonis]|nr:hypothetical protein [Aquincola tertiaricarbonis]
MRFAAALIYWAARREHASDEEMARSLQGIWRPEHLFPSRKGLYASDFG